MSISGKSHGAHPNLPPCKQTREDAKEARDLIMKLSREELLAMKASHGNS